MFLEGVSYKIRREETKIMENEEEKIKGQDI